MRKGIKIGILVLCGALLLAVGTYSLLRFGFAIDVLDQSGWYQADGVTQYRDYYGRPLLRWQQIEGNNYYFDPAQDGAMVTGWLEADGIRYYLGENGALCTGWLELGEKTYFLDSTGAAVTGWQIVEEKLYCFDQTGILLTGWQEKDGRQYYFGEDGVLCTGWLELETGKFYFDEAGNPVTLWQEIEGKRYYFDDTGAIATGWLDWEQQRYYLDENGTPVTGWVDSSDGKRCFDADGVMLTGWAELEGKRYFFGEDGIMHTGWLDYEGDRYYLREDGTMAVGEVEIDGVSSFFTSTGKYVILVNPWHFMPEDYEPDLVDLEGFQVDSSCRDALQQMMQACRDAGYRCVINNTYRSVATQQYMWNVRIDMWTEQGMSYDAAVAYIGQSLALPRASEHHLGLAVDITGTDGMYAWLAEHCWDYGFILRYPDDRIDITGIIYEPWHFRYVGTELSKELQELGLCMEEYMTMLTESQK